MAYDYMGRRISKTTTGGLSLASLLPASMTYDGETYYYVTDGNKNITAPFDAEGNRVAEYAYGPFGSDSAYGREIIN